MARPSPLRRSTTGLHRHSYLSKLLVVLVFASAVVGGPGAALAAPPSVSTHLLSATLAAAGDAYAYAAISSSTSYDIFVAGGGEKDRRVATIKVDGIYFSDATARLSPDGSTVAVRITGDRYEGSSLLVVDVKSGKYAQVAATKSGGESIGRYVWSVSGSTLAFVRSGPALSPSEVDNAFGSIYVYAGGQVSRLAGSHGNDRLLSFSGDGEGVYASRQQQFGDYTLEHLAYIPLAGGEATMLLRSQPGLRYSHFAVWSPPGAQAKVASLAEGDFSLAPNGVLIEPATATPTATSTDTPVPPTDTPTAEPPTATPGDATPVDATPGSAEESATSVPAVASASLEATAGSTVTPAPEKPTSAIQNQPAPPASSVSSRVSTVGRLSGPNGLGIVVSDPAGTMPGLLRRDAEAFSRFEWTSDGKGLVMGGTRSGASWAVNMDGGRWMLDAPLRDVDFVAWSGGGTQLVLSDVPATELTTVDYTTGNVASSRGVGVTPKGAAPAVQLAVPYVHQVNDVTGSDGNWACGPTSVVMALAYYGKLDPWPVYETYAQADAPPNPTDAAATPVAVTDAHASGTAADWAPYITNSFTAAGHTYGATARDPQGRSVAGLYGTICPAGLADWGLIQAVLSWNGLSSQYVGASWDGIVGALKRGHPVILGNLLTSAGHIIVVTGYTPDGNLVVNDPYGNRFEPGYGGNNGHGVLYPWKRATARTAIEVIGVYPPPSPTPRPTITPVPPTETPTEVVPIATNTPEWIPAATPPSESPTAEPVIQPTIVPTAVPRVTPEIVEPTPVPQSEPTPTPIAEPAATQVPLIPTSTPLPLLPTAIPTEAPTETPTAAPTPDGSNSLYHGLA